MNALTFLLTLEEPLLATQPAGGDPNSAESYDFIPGSLIRGALVAAYLQGPNPPSDIARDANARDLFLNGRVRYLNAFPVNPAAPGERLLPRPLAWFEEKGQSHATAGTLANLAIPGAPELRNPKSLKDNFCSIFGTAVQFHSPARQINVHNASEDRNRKQGGTSQVFRYDALAAGQQFAAVILFDDAVAALQQTLQPLLTGSLYLGGSHFAGYGHVIVSEVKPHTNWREYQPAAPHQDCVTITLLSDAIVRNDAGRYTDQLAALLAGGREPLSAFVRTRIVGGFNRKWGMPLDQAWAVQQGSVLTFRRADVDPATLSRLEQQGIGERRAEGFGRLAVDWHSRPEYSTQTATAVPAATAPQFTTAAGRELARRMLRRQLEAELEYGLALMLDVDTYRFNRLPSATQLARARVAARNALLQQTQDTGSTQTLPELKRYFVTLNAASKSWHNARLNGKPLDDWVIDQCDLSRADFEAQFLTARQPEPPHLAGLRAALTGDLQASITARYIDSILKLAIEEVKRLQGESVNA